MKRKAKLQKQFAYKYKDKAHYKHVVTISDSLIKELGWQIGAEIEQRVRGDTLVMAPIIPRKVELEDSTMGEIPKRQSPKISEEKLGKRVHKNAKRRIQ